MPGFHIYLFNSKVYLLTWCIKISSITPNKVHSESTTKRPLTELQATQNTPDNIKGFQKLFSKNPPKYNKKLQYFTETCVKKHKIAFCYIYRIKKKSFLYIFPRLLTAAMMSNCKQWFISSSPTFLGSPKDHSSPFLVKSTFLQCFTCHILSKSPPKKSPPKCSKQTNKREE